MRNGILLVSAWLFIAARLWAADSIVSGAAPGDQPLKYALVVTGGELLEGVYPDAHTPYITRTLRPLGCRCVGSILVDDVREEMLQALHFATNEAPLVIVTGGLGPTPNDITRETLSDFTGIPLREHPEVLARMEQLLGQPKDQLRPNLRRQCLVPVQGSYLPNAQGSAVGLVFDLGERLIIALPGPPRELQAMVDQELVGLLRRRFGIRTLGASMTLRFVGIGQSLIDQTLKEHALLSSNLTVTSVFEGSRVDFTFSLPGHDLADQARLEKLNAAIRRHLGSHLYAEGNTSLETAIARQLLARGGSLVVAEIASGGQLAAALSGAEGSQRLLAGAYAAPTEPGLRKLLGLEAASESGDEPVKRLASAAGKLTGSRWAIAVGPVETDTRGSQFARVALLLDGQSMEVQRLNPGGARGQFVTLILDALRRKLQP